MKEIDKLKQLDLFEKRKKLPNVPSYALSRTEFDDKTSNGLTRCIIRFIQLRGGQAERINSEGKVVDTRKSYNDVLGNVRTVGSIKRVKASSTVGTADISATINGRSVKIEVKVGNDVQSHYQKEYQQSVERAGGLYVLARNFEGFGLWYKLNFGE